MGNNILEFRVGSAGAGLFAGCGTGIGFLTPVSLHAIPVLGQLANSVAASFGQLDSATGGLGRRFNASLNAQLAPLKMNVGVGCGFALGYGWGAGVMVSPTALSSFLSCVAAATPLKIRSAISRKPRCLELNLNEATLSAASDRQLGAIRTQAVLPGDSSLDKDIMELTKLVLRQQVAIEKLKTKLEDLEEKLKPRNE